MKRIIGLIGLVALLATAGCRFDHTEAEHFHGFGHQPQLREKGWCDLLPVQQPGTTLFRLRKARIMIPDWQAPSSDYLEFVLPTGDVRMGRVFRMAEVSVWNVGMVHRFGRGQVDDGSIRVVRQGKAEYEIEIASPQLPSSLNGVHIFVLSQDPPEPLRDTWVRTDQAHRDAIE